MCNLNKRISAPVGILIIIIIAILAGGAVVWCGQETDKINFSQLNLKGEGLALPSFEDFPVSEKFEGTPAAVDYSNHPSAQTFYTKITEGAKGEPNFAGHYTIVEWGCGTSCQTGVVFDAKTGAIFNIPVSELGKKYQIDSALLIVNPDLDEVAENYPALIFEGISTRYYKWQNNAFELIKEVKFQK